MKQNNHVQYFVESNNAISLNIISPEKFKKSSYLPESYSLGKKGQLQGRPNELYDLDSVASTFDHGATLFPVVKNEPLNYESQVKKMDSIQMAFKPLFNDYQKKTAACLSDVEMALDCYNVSALQFSTLALKDLFFDMKMPAVYQLAVQMEELAKEYQMEEIKVLLRAIKKIIGQILKHSK